MLRLDPKIQSLAETRRLLRGLRPLALEGVNLLEALDDLIHQRDAALSTIPCVRFQRSKY